MSDWSKRTKTLAILGGLMAVFGVMTIWTYASGKQVASKRISEKGFEKEKFQEPHVTFELDKQTPVELTVDGTTLRDSWIWTKVVVADGENRPVADYTFDLSYYDGGDWEEGDPDKSQVFVLPEGEYQVIVHGKDAKRSSGYTRESRERLQVTVEKDVKLARYPFGALIIVGFFFLGYMFVTGEGETSIHVDDSAEFDAFGDDDGFGDEGFGEDEEFGVDEGFGEEEEF